MIFGNFITEDNRGNNSVFGEKQDIPLGYYDLLREAFCEKGIEINTPDLNEGKNVSFDLVVEGQDFSAKGRSQYLIAVENPFHNKLNADIGYCRRFSKVFTWNPDLDVAGNAIRVFSPHQIAMRKFPPFDERNIFCCVINANKSFREPVSSDLYRERLDVIRWYEKYAPDSFELYGRGWERPPPAYDWIGRVKRSIPSMRYKLFGYKYFPSYKGKLAEKDGILLNCCQFRPTT